MKKSTKAVLLSAFVFPGVGHIYLKKFIPGVVLVGASFAVIIYLITRIVERAFQISEKIQSSDVQLDIGAITELVSKHSTGADARLLNITAAALIICWLIGIVDSYRVGCVRDKNDDVLVDR